MLNLKVLKLLAGFMCFAGPLAGQGLEPLRLEQGMRAYTTRVFVEGGEASSLIPGSEVDIYEVVFREWDLPPSEGYTDTVALFEIIKSAVIAEISVVQGPSAALPVVEVYVRLELPVRQLEGIISAEIRYSYFPYSKPDEPRRRQKAGATLIMTAAGADYPTLCETCNSISRAELWVFESAPVCTRKIRRGVELTVVVVPCPEEDD